MNSFRCPQCGLLNFETATVCKRCKTEFNSFASANNHAESYSNTTNNNYAASQGYEPTPVSSYKTQNYQTQNFAGFGDGANYQTSNRPLYQPETNKKTGLAIASMVIGCVGFVACWGFLGIGSLTGLVLGIVALTKIKKQPNEYGGQNFAVAGIALNGILLLFIPIVLAIAIPNLLAARRSANEGSAIGGLRTLQGAESIYMNAHGNRCGDLSELRQAGLIDSTLANGQKSGYNFSVAKKPNGNCDLNATPQNSGTGNRSFYASTDEGKIHSASKNGLPADSRDPVIDINPAVSTKNAQIQHF